MRIEPAEVETLTSDELTARLKPALRRAQLGASPEAFELNKENLPAAVYMILRDWETDPRIDGRAVDFEEFLVTRLGVTLRRLYKEQNPDNYRDGKHDLEGAPELLDHDQIKEIGDSTEASEVSFESLAAAMKSAGISPASQPGVLEAIYLVEGGSVVNGRGMAWALGHEGHKARPATAPLIAAQVLIDRMTLTAPCAGEGAQPKADEYTKAYQDLLAQIADGTNFLRSL